jgi:prephenate dehydrogenase
MFEKIALIGIGLIGGSIALDARKRGPRQVDRRGDAQRGDGGLPPTG